MNMDKIDEVVFGMGEGPISDMLEFNLGFYGNGLEEQAYRKLKTDLEDMRRDIDKVLALF